MSLRQKVRRVFSRSESRAKPKGNGIKIEYYKRSEIPRSKFKGPFDKEHQKKLAAWSFDEAQAERPRSLDLSLSPCTTLPDHLQPPCHDDDAVAPDQIVSPAPEVTVTDDSAIVTHDEYAPTRDTDSGSSSSTAVDSDSYSASLRTLLPEVLRQDSIAQIKESVRYTSPAIRTISPPPLSPKGTYMPFSPDDLTRALNAVQICSY